MIITNKKGKIKHKQEYEHEHEREGEGEQEAKTSRCNDDKCFSVTNGRMDLSKVVYKMSRCLSQQSVSLTQKHTPIHTHRFILQLRY